MMCSSSFFPRTDIENAQALSPVNLTDRVDVADFLCTLAGIECIEDLSRLLNMPEPMVRQVYNIILNKIGASYSQALGRDQLQEIFQIWAIIQDIAEFADRVGYTAEVHRMYYDNIADGEDDGSGEIEHEGQAET